MINILGIILGILISSLWIFLPLKRVPEDIRLKKRTYIGSIIWGATVCTFVIIILESLWDKYTGIDPSTQDNVLQAFLVSFTRAALIEEAVKYIFARNALKTHKPEGRLQYMLLAGTIGMGYGITECLVSYSAVSMLFGTAFAMHIMFQFITGWYLYEADNTEDKSKKRTYRIKAFIVPFILHGVWDFVQFGGVLLLGDDITFKNVTVLLVMLAVVICGIIGEVKMAKYLKRI